jgi:hypothetical protein
MESPRPDIVHVKRAGRVSRKVNSRRRGEEKAKPRGEKLTVHVFDSIVNVVSSDAIEGFFQVAREDSATSFSNCLSYFHEFLTATRYTNTKVNSEMRPSFMA